MVNMPNLWRTCSIYGKHAQFMVNMLNLWWTCSIYGEYAQFMVNMPDMISWLDWPWKTILKWPFKCPNPSTGSKDTMIFILKSFDLYSHSWLCLTTGFALKNYPEITLCMSKSVHWIQRYSEIYFEVGWFVQSQLIKSAVTVQISWLQNKYHCIFWSSGWILTFKGSFWVSFSRPIQSRGTISCDCTNKLTSK